MKHVHTVLPVLHAQAQTELGVRPDVVIHSTAGLLCRQDQVHTKGTSDLGDADELLHELRFLTLEFCELVDDDKQMRHRYTRLVALIQTGIEIDIIDTVLGEDALPAHIFTLDTDHGAAHLVAGQVGDLSSQMRQA